MGTLVSEVYSVAANRVDNETFMELERFVSTTAARRGWPWMQAAWDRAIAARRLLAHSSSANSAVKAEIASQEAAAWSELVNELVHTGLEGVHLAWARAQEADASEQRRMFEEAARRGC